MKVLQISGNSIFIQARDGVREISYKSSSLSPSQAIEIYRKYHYKGYKPTFLATIYQRNHNTILSIIKGRSYSWIKSYLTERKNLEDNELSLEVSKKEKSSQWKRHFQIMTLP